MKIIIIFLLFFWGTSFLFSQNQISMSQLCDYSKLVDGLPEGEKREREELYLSLLGVLKKLDTYRKNLERNKMYIDMFPGVYYHVTSLEADNIRKGIYEYPKWKMNQMIGFFEAYEVNRTLWDKGQKNNVEPHWINHFSTAEETQGNDLSVFCIGFTSTLTTAIKAHIVYDLPRSIRFTNMQYQHTSHPNYHIIQKEYGDVDAVFDKAQKQSLTDLKSISPSCSSLSDNWVSNQLAPFIIKEMRGEAWINANNQNHSVNYNGVPLGPHPYDQNLREKFLREGKYFCNNLPTLFLFDLSGSMNERMPSGVSRIEEAKAAAKATLRTMANATNQGVSQEIDIRGFSGACVSDPTFPITNGFTTDFSAVENAVNRIPIPNGGTPLFEAIQSSRQKLLQRLDQTGAKQAKLIILSDGQATCTPIRPADVYAFGQYGQTTQNISTSGNPLLSSNLRYYAVGFGIDPGSPAERDLQYLAQISGGKYLNAQNQFELTRAFQKFNKIFVPKPAPALVDVPATSRDVFDRGVSTIYAEEYETALERCKTYVQQHPEDCHGIYNFALMQEANEYYKSAIASFEKYLQLCPGADDGIHVRKQIADLKQDYEAFLIFNRKVIMSDMEYLDLHFKKIQNGQSVALAQEFIAFIKEKYSYYQNLPAILEINNRAFDSASKEVFRGLSSCIETIKRNSQTWDRDATPVLSKTYIAMERLLQTF